MPDPPQFPKTPTIGRPGPEPAGICPRCSGSGLQDPFEPNGPACWLCGGSGEDTVEPGMIKVTVYGACPTGDQKIHRLDLSTSGPFPNDLTVIQATTAHKNDADCIANALWATLPGGTIDALFAEMARRSVSSLIVRHQQPEPEDGP